MKNLLKTLDKTKFVENLVGVSLLLGALVESLFLVGCKFNFYNAFNTVLTDNYGNTEADVVERCRG